MSTQEKTPTSTSYPVLAEFQYERSPVERGYTNRTLYVNLSANTVDSKPVTQQMKDIFVGGRGFGLWLLWNAVRDVPSLPSDTSPCRYSQATSSAATLSRWIWVRGDQRLPPLSPP